jgi:HAMP domain-containing protein
MPNARPEYVREEELLLRRQRRGGVMKTVGKVLLWMDLIIGAFAYNSMHDGSYLFAWWFVAELIAGAGLFWYGASLRSEATRRLAALSPTAVATDVDDETEQQRRAS